MSRPTVGVSRPRSPSGEAGYSFRGCAGNGRGSPCCLCRRPRQWGADRFPEGARRGPVLRQDAPSPAVVGITGTVGKTTTKDALATILRHAGKRVSATAGNLNNEIGLPLTILASDPRTEVLVLEMGATHAGDIQSLCTMAPPDIGVLTAISPVHLDSFGTLEGLAAAKGELALSLPESGTLVAPAGAPETATGSNRKLGRPTAGCPWSLPTATYGPSGRRLQSQGRHYRLR